MVLVVEKEVKELLWTKKETKYFALPQCQLLIANLSKISGKEAVQLFQRFSFGAVHRPNAYTSLKDKIFLQELKRKVHFLIHQDPSEYMQLIRERRSEYRLANRLLSYQIIVVGGSTGATDSVVELVKALPAAYPLPVVIAQHIPDSFSARLANRLEGLSKNRIVIPQNGEPLFAGTVYLLPSDRNMVINSPTTADNWYFGESTEEFKEFNHPSIDGFLDSLGSAGVESGVYISLSGMGKDGALGAASLNSKKGKVIIQDPEECLLQSMPLATKEQCKQVEIMTIEEITHFLKSIVGQTSN